MATWVPEMSRHGGLQQCRNELNLRHIPLTPSEAQNANKNCFVCQQERQRLQMATGKISGGGGVAAPTIAGQWIILDQCWSPLGGANRNRHLTLYLALNTR